MDKKNYNGQENAEDLIHRIWQTIKLECEQIVKKEPAIGSYLDTFILRADCLSKSLGQILSHKLKSEFLPYDTLCNLFADAYKQDSSLIIKASCDINAVYTRDPAVSNYSHVLLYLKGFHAVSAYRLAHFLYKNNQYNLATMLQNEISRTMGVDINPAAKIGCGIMLDHASGIVIGETCVIDNNVSILQGVTLGGTGKEHGDRHPKIRQGVLIGAGAKVLGNIEIGEFAKIGAGSVVLDPVPAYCSVAGVPAKIISSNSSQKPAYEMDQYFAICEQTK